MYMYMTWNYLVVSSSSQSCLMKASQSGVYGPVGSKCQFKSICYEPQYRFTSMNRSYDLWNALMTFHFSIFTRVPGPPLHRAVVKARSASAFSTSEQLNSLYSITIHCILTPLSPELNRWCQHRCREGGDRRVMTSRWRKLTNSINAVKDDSTWSRHDTTSNRNTLGMIKLTTTPGYEEALWLLGGRDGMNFRASAQGNFLRCERPNIMDVMRFELNKNWSCFWFENESKNTLAVNCWLLNFSCIRSSISVTMSAFHRLELNRFHFFF